MEKGRDLILVTGATGKQGGATARQLLSRGHRVRALTRKPDSDAARALAGRGAQIVQGDLDHAPSIEHALEGVWGVFAVQNTWEAGVDGEERQGKLLVAKARQYEVQHYVYTSVGSAHRKTGIPHFENKFRIEHALRASGIPSWAVLRPVFFMENWSSAMFKPSILDGKLTLGVRPETVLQMIAVDDIGKFALRAFEQHRDWNGRELDIAGDEGTMPELAATLSRILGSKVEFAPPPKADPSAAHMLEWFDTVGYDANIARLEREYDIRLTRFADWAKHQKW